MVVLMGKSSINGPFSMAMLNDQRVDHLKLDPTDMSVFIPILPHTHVAKESIFVMACLTSRPPPAGAAGAPKPPALAPHDTRFCEQQNSSKFYPLVI